MTVQHFKCGDSANEHRGWCITCAETCVGDGRKGAARLRRWAHRHVAQTGHEIRIDVTRQHGYKKR